MCPLAPPDAALQICLRRTTFCASGIRRRRRAGRRRAVDGQRADRAIRPAPWRAGAGLPLSRLPATPTSLTRLALACCVWLCNVCLPLQRLSAALQILSNRTDRTPSANEILPPRRRAPDLRPHAAPQNLVRFLLLRDSRAANATGIWGAERVRALRTVRPAPPAHCCTSAVQHLGCATAVQHAGGGARARLKRGSPTTSP